MTEPGPGRVDCAVIGGGLSGLACAHALVAAGRSVVVVEAGDSPGGRARTTWHEGRPVDRGFQVMFGAYPETRRFVKEIGIPPADLRPVAGGAAFMGPGGPTRLGGGRLAFTSFAGLPPADRARLARLGMEVLAAPTDALLDQDDLAVSTEAYLRQRGFSETAIEGFFRPLFGVILLDRSLGADPGYFRFLLAMLARGPAVLPTDGLGMIAEWAAAAVRTRGGAVRLGVGVERLERGPDARIARAVLTDGSAVTARQFVLCVDPREARRLLADHDPESASRLPTRFAGVATARFALRRPLYSGRLILVNAEPHLDAGPRIDLVCQTTNITRPGLEGGPHIVLASCVTTPEGGMPDDLEEAVERTLARWAPRFAWSRHARSLGTIHHDVAQFRPLAGVRRDLPGPRTAVANLILAGDATLHPSLEGAVASGTRAGRIVAGLLT